MRLWLVRHAQPLITPGICYGRLDVAADAEASAACARQLAAQLPAGTRVASSPLQRCAQLARQLHKLRPDLRYETDARLQEMDFGHWEGRAWQAIPPAELQAWTDDFAHHVVGRTGQSVAAFMASVASAYDALGAGKALGLKPQPPAPALVPAFSPDNNKPANVPAPFCQDACPRPEQAPDSHPPGHANAPNPTNLTSTSSAASGSGTHDHSTANPARNVLWITHAGVIRAVGLLAQGLRHIERAEQWPLEAPKYGQWRTLELHIDPAHCPTPCASTG